MDVSCDWGKSGRLNCSLRQTWNLFGPFPLTLWPWILVLVYILFAYIQIIHSGYHSLYFIVNLDIEVRLNKIKRKKWMALVFAVLVFLLFFSFSFSFFLSFFLSFCCPHLIVLHFHVIFFFSQLFCLPAVCCKTLVTSYIWFRNLLNTNHALHIVTDSVTDYSVTDFVYDVNAAEPRVHNSAQTLVTHCERSIWDVTF